MKNTKTALVTGASGGLGLEFARLLAADGYRLVLVSRNESALKEVTAEMQSLYGVEAQYFATDLSKPENVESLLHQLQSGNISIDCLINNAGFGDAGYFLEKPFSLHHEMMMLNMHTLTKLTYALAQAMKAKGHGYILNLASTAAFQPAPAFAVYAATKSYVLSLSEALRYELRNTGVSVTVSCPGPTETPFHDRASTRTSKIMKMGMMKPEVVAEQAFRAMKSRKRRVVHGWLNKLLTFSGTITPRDLLIKTTHDLMKP
jgi:short-subunit dehydrogenase